MSIDAKGEAVMAPASVELDQYLDIYDIGCLPQVLTLILFSLKIALVHAVLVSNGSSLSLPSNNRLMAVLNSRMFL